MKEQNIKLDVETRQANTRLNISIADYFVKACSTAYYVNLSDETVQIISDAGIMEKSLIKKIKSVREGIKFYIDYFVHPEDKEMLAEKLSPEFIRKVLKESDSHAFTFRDIFAKKESVFRCIILRGEDDDHVAVFFRNVTKEFSSELEKAEMETEHKALQDNYERMMVLEDNFESLYDVNLETGEYEVHVKGETFSEVVKEHFVEKNEFFSDLEQNIENAIYVEDRAGVRKVLNPKYIRRALKKDNHFDWYYRLLFFDKPIWFRMRIVYKNADRNNVIIGVFNAEEEVAARRKEEQLRNEMINQMVGDDGLFLIDCVNDTRTTIHDNCYGASNYTDEENYSSLITRYIDNCVAPNDREVMREGTAPDKMMEKLATQKEYSIEYRDITTGVLRFYEMKIARLSDTEVLQSFIERDKEILDRLIFTKMEEEYVALYVVDLDSETVRIVKNKSWYNNGSAGDTIPYTESMLAFADDLEAEPKEFFTRIADIEYVKRELAHEDKHTYLYKSSVPGEKNWVDVTSFVILRHEDGTPAMFTLGFSMADSLVAGRQEIQSRLKEDMQMIGGLASGYHALYYFNMDENVFKIYSLDGRRVHELKPFVHENGDPLEMMMKFSLSDLVHPDDRHLFVDLNVEKVREKLAHTKKFTIRFRRNIDGEYLWTEMDAIKYEDVDERANVIAFGFAVRDEEIRKERAQQQMLEDALNAAEAANKSKTSFLFNMSHDIRTPMNAMIGFTAMARKYAGDRKKVREYLEKIDISGHQLLSLINQVLEMARIESGKIEFVEKPINILEKFNSIVTVLSEQAKANGLDFHYSLENVTHCNVLADEARMGSITMNIAGNAMKYTPEGGTIDFRFGELPCDREGYGTYRMTVTDTGIGMSEEYMKELFEPFSRENSTTVSQIQGTGLGMSIVKSLVDLLGGTIDVKSEPGKGTCFTITVNLKLDNEQHTKAPAEKNPHKVVFKGHRILLVDDNEMNREIAKNIFEDSGLIVDEADDGDVAVNIIRKTVDRGEADYYDCILMDVQMPRMNGYDATKAIRKITAKTKNHIPIIAMTANAFEEDRQNALAAGMDAHLAKPIDIQQSLTVLAKFLE